MSGLTSSEGCLDGDHPDAAVLTGESCHDASKRPEVNRMTVQRELLPKVTHQANQQSGRAQFEARQGDLLQGGTLVFTASNYVVQLSSRSFHFVLRYATAAKARSEASANRAIRPLQPARAQVTAVRARGSVPTAPSGRSSRTARPPCSTGCPSRSPATTCSGKRSWPAPQRAPTILMDRRVGSIEIKLCAS